MKRLLFLVIVFSCFLSAKPVDISRARTVAINFYNFISNKDYGRNNIIHEEATEYEGIITRYLFVFKDSNFVIVSADDATYPIFAYTLEKSWHPEIKPPNYLMWVETEYDNWVKYVRENGKETKEYLKYWEEIESGTFTSFKTLGTKSVGPLLSTRWGQGRSNDWYDECAYNYYAPSRKGGCSCDNKCAAGCVAVAMAQIMRYWKSPANQFDWCLMPEALLYKSDPYYSMHRNAIATLIRDCGKQSKSQYCVAWTCQTFAWPSKADKAFKNDYGYSTSGVKRRRKYDDSDWKDMLRSSLDDGKPVFYAGKETGSLTSVHAFVCDGYSGDFFSFNFGWNGIDNGNYYISAIQFNKWNRAIFDITPNNGTAICPPCIRQLFISNTLSSPKYYNIPVIWWNSSDPSINFLYNYLIPFNPYPKNSHFVFKNGKMYLKYDPIKYGEIIFDNGTIPDKIEIDFEAYKGITLRNCVIEEGAYFTAKTTPCPDYYISDKIAGPIYDNSDINQEQYVKQVKVDKFSFKDMKIEVYPNPTQSSVTVISNVPIKTIMVYDCFGKVIKNIKIDDNRTTSTKIMLGNFPKGVYMLKINNRYFVKIAKI